MPLTVRLIFLTLVLAAQAVAAPLPDDLARRVERLGRGNAEAMVKLNQAARVLLEAGWFADSLILDGEAIRLVGPQQQALIVTSVRGATEQNLFAIGESASSPARLEELCDHWLNGIDRLGHPFAQVWLNCDAAGDTLLLEAVFVTGPSGGLGEVSVTGLERLSEKFIKSYLHLERSGDFSLERARHGRDRLAATGWFKRVADPQLGWDAVTQRVCVLYAVEERRRSNRVVAAIGGGGGKTTGVLEIDIFSPFGGGRGWRLAGNWQGDERSLLDIKLSEPRLLGRGLALDLGFNRVTQDSTWLQLAYEADLRLLLPAGMEGVAGFGYERSLFSLTERKMNRRRHRFGFNWRSLNTLVPGERRVGVIMDYLIRKSDLPGETTEMNQFEGSLNWSWIWRPAGNWKVRNRGGGKWLLPEGGGFNVAEIFSIGGTNTLRGFDEEHFRGDRVAWTGLELALGDPLEISLFMDYGWGRWLRRDEPEATFAGWGVGLGLKAPAPGGLLTLSLALGEEKRLGDIRVHVGVDTGF
ncbi:MAG: BamA/TamA family outer membrane protein [bacterium]|nr:BamA/TamA family outer membrane protein [bacterium]